MYYAPYIEWAEENGIVNGVGKGKFEADAPITREQMVVILMNYTNIRGIKILAEENVPTFIDSEDISSWAVEAVEGFKNLGIINGRADGSFDPQGRATRAEVSTMFARLIKKIAK